MGFQDVFMVFCEFFFKKIWFQKLRYTKQRAIRPKIRLDSSIALRVWILSNWSKNAEQRSILTSDKSNLLSDRKDTGAL
jgi:hypothetical protein